MIVVSDTTPLNYLVLVEVIDVLPHLFERVYVPPAVVAEMSHVDAPEAVRRWASLPPAWLELAAPNARLPSTARLGRGEADALSLAKERQIREVLIDERRGRRVAQREGLIPLPTLAVLEMAAIRGVLDLPKTIEKLRRTSFRMPDDQVDTILARDAARRRLGGTA